MGEIKVVYEKGIFKPLEDIELKDGTKAVVVVRPKGIADVLEKFSRKMDKDILKEFLEERSIDSDGQHDASEIPQLLTALGNGSDLVIGSRFCDGNGKDIPGYRKVGMKVLDVATNVAGGVSVTDSQSGFRAYGRRAIERIYIKGSDMSAGSEVLLQAKDHDLRIKEVPIHCSYDVERGSTQNPVSHGVKTLVKILHDMELRRPLYYFVVPGMLMAGAGILMGLEFLRVFAHGGTLQYGPALLMIMLTLVGSFMALTGIILHSISKMMNQMQDRDRADRESKRCPSP